MELHDDTSPTGARSTTIEPDLRDGHATSVSRRRVSGTILALDLLAIVAFVDPVVIPRLTPGTHSQERSDRWQACSH
jgi:hypothetical protein